LLRPRRDPGLEILALRQQLAVLKRRHPRPHLRRGDGLFWVVLPASALVRSNPAALFLKRPLIGIRWERNHNQKGNAFDPWGVSSALVLDGRNKLQ
jgi:hypothetical protein